MLYGIRSYAKSFQYMNFQLPLLNRIDKTNAYVSKYETMQVYVHQNEINIEIYV